MESDNKRMAELRQAKDHLTALAKAEIKLPGLQEVVDRIDQCTFDEKRLALDALNIKVKATTDNIEITGVIPVDITPAQTSDGGENPIHHCTNIGMFAK